MAIVDLIVAKVDAIRDHAGRIRRSGALDGDRFVTDQLVQDAALFNYVQATQAAVDLAAHVVAEARWETPRTMAETFAILAKHGGLDGDLAKHLGAIAGLRNLVVHRYGVVDAGRVQRDLDADLVALERFADAMLAAAPASDGA